MTTSQTEEATDNKQDSEETGAVQESGGEESKPQEPAAVEAPVEEAAAEQGPEETQDQKAEDDKADSEEKAEAEATEEAKAESGEKVEAAEVKTGAKPEAAEEPKAETKEKAEAETEAKPEAEEKVEAAEQKEKPEVESKIESEEKVETEHESEEKAETKAEERAKTEAKAEEKTEAKTSVPDQSQESATGEISETIQQMTQSPAVLPGESGKPTMGNPAHISVSSGVCAKDIMQKEVVWGSPEENVQQALTKMQQQDSGYIMIGQDGTLEGIVSKSDITGVTSIYLRPMFAKWHGPLDDATLQIKLKWIMSRPVRTVRPETPLETIIENMCQFGGRGLPVVDEQGKVQGLVTVFDIFRTLLNTGEDVSTTGKTSEAPALT